MASFVPEGHLRLVEPLEDVAVLSVLGRAAVLLDKTVDVFKACDDALVASRPTGGTWSMASRASTRSVRTAAVSRRWKSLVS
jgi:hypothetical protein